MRVEVVAEEAASQLGEGALRQPQREPSQATVMGPQPAKLGPCKPLHPRSRTTFSPRDPTLRMSLAPIMYSYFFEDTEIYKYKCNRVRVDPITSG